MYKILIVDDEAIIRRMLRKVITENISELEICAEAANGVEGAELAKKHEPDVIISDICMNELTGLDMISKIKGIVPDCKIIILTGYRDFEYARRALELDVMKFLLKPTKKNELLAAINEAVEQLDQDRKKRAQLDKYKDSVEKQIFYIGQKIISDLCLGVGIQYTDNQPQSMLEMCHIDIKKFYMILFNIKSTITKKENYLIQYGVKEMVDKYLGEGSYFLSIDRENSVAITKNEDGALKPDKLLEQLQELTLRFKEMYDIELNIGISTHGCGIDDLQVKYQECKKAISCVKQLQIGNIIFWGDMEVEQISGISGKLAVMKRCLIESIVEGDMEKVKNITEMIIAEIQQDESINLLKLKSFYFQIAVDIEEINAGTSRGDKKGKHRLAELENNIDRCGKKEDLALILRLMVEGTVNKLNRINKEILSQKVHMVIDYINEHYSEDITLDDIAHNVYISVFYLSRIFKKEMNINVVDYINQFRIKKATELMMNKEYKIYEIAEMVGINSPHYFSKLFKKYVGQTPTEYMNIK